MNIFFTIDALSAKGDKAWRLLEDGKRWREAVYAEPFATGDARLDERGLADDWVGRRLLIDKEVGLIPKVKAGTFDFLMRGIFAHAVLHRLSSAPIPDKAQMLETMERLMPGTPWLLYLNPAGQFTAVDSSSTKIIGNLDIAVRGEIASSPDYVGPKAAGNEAMMNPLYLQFLAGWWEHLTTAQMAVFVPDVEKLKEESFYAERIRQWRPESGGY